MSNRERLLQTAVNLEAEAAAVRLLANGMDKAKRLTAKETRLIAQEKLYIKRMSKCR